MKFENEEEIFVENYHKRNIWYICKIILFVVDKTKIIALYEEYIRREVY